MANSDVDPLEWARQHTPILQQLATECADSSVFSGYRIAVNSHLEAKTGVLIETLAAGGAEVLVTGSEPYSTGGAVVDALSRNDRIRLFVEADMDEPSWIAGQHEVLSASSDLILDDGCELIAKAHADQPTVVDKVMGATEQTTAGIHRLEAMEDGHQLRFPVYGVNDTPMQHRFDNVHGTGESALANVMMTTNTILSGTRVAGWGRVGRVSLGPTTEDRGFPLDICNSR